MKKTIWKWNLLPSRTTLNLPLGTIILDVQVQNEDVVLWGMLDLDEPKKEERSFISYGTGHPLPRKPGKYIGTFQLVSLGLVFHVFEEGR